MGVEEERVDQKWKQHHESGKRKIIILINVNVYTPYLRVAKKKRNPALLIMYHCAALSTKVKRGKLYCYRARQGNGQASGTLAVISSHTGGHLSPHRLAGLEFQLFLCFSSGDSNWLHRRLNLKLPTMRELGKYQLRPYS